MLVIVADMHIGDTPEEAEKLSVFLSSLSATSHDICFAGDILELWIAEVKFNSSIQRSFMEWCRKEKTRRKIYFIEGNHEFFVCRKFRNCFTEADTEGLRIGELLVIHGDNLPGQNVSHRLFRWLTKGTVCLFLLRFVPNSRKIVAWIKKKFECRALNRKNFLPMEAIQAWKLRIFRKSNPPKTMIFGHFHLEYLEKCPDGCTICGLPAWKDNQKIVLADPVTGKIQICKMHG